MGEKQDNTRQYEGIAWLVAAWWAVLPVNFSTDHKQMLSHLAMIVSKEYLCIPKESDKLTIALRTAYPNELSLDKERTSYSDSLDACRLIPRTIKVRGEIKL